MKHQAEPQIHKESHAPRCCHLQRVPSSGMSSVIGSMSGAGAAGGVLGREPRVAVGPFSGQVEPGSPHSLSRRNAGLEDVRGIEQPKQLAK
jgi:hypothetical protein